MDGTVVAIGGLVVLIGLIGTVLPVAPGLPLIWIGGVGTFVVTGMGTAGWVVAVLLTLQLVIGISAKYVLASTGTPDERIPRTSLGAALAGAVIGFFVIPVVGFVIGAVLGVYLAERRRLEDDALAREATVRLAKRVGVGMVIEVSAGLAMAATFVTAVALRW